MNFLHLLLPDFLALESFFDYNSAQIKDIQASHFFASVPVGTSGMERRITDMFREMRRKRQMLPPEECTAVLERGTSGVLAVAGDEDYPYAVPISYVYCDGKIYFHCAKTGHKLDAVRRNEKVSFCVIDQDLVVPEKYTTCFRSVIVFGKIRVLEDAAEIRETVRKLAVKYSPDESEDDRQAEIEKHFAALCMLELSIEHMSGKAAKELMNVENA